jgi:hypothetical protein
MLRASYGRELAAWCFLPLMIGAVEGGVVGVIAKEVFAGAVSSRALNLAVAVLAGAPAFANILSFLWAALSHGRHKIRFLVALQLAVASCVTLIAVAPRDPAGLFIFTSGVVGARMFWSGVVTVRSTVWRANYPRHTRARLAGKLATVQALGMTLVGVGIGAAMKGNDEAFRLLFPIGAASGLIGTWIYAGLRIRGHRTLLRAEANGTETRGSLVSPFQLRRVLLDDDRFRRYMTCMFVFGTGNLMVSAPLVIMLKDRFGLDPFASILIVSSIPTLLMPISIPIWSRLLDRVHIIQFRAVHSWAFAASTAMMLLGAVTGRPALFWLGAICKGIAFGGGVLGWNLGHHDFAPVERSSLYMGVHVTLTGVRGMLAPVIGVTLYEILEAAHAGAGAWTLAVCLSLSVAGAVGFVRLRRTLSGRGGDSEFEDGPPIEPPAAT